MGRALETDRLLLRPFRPEDRADCFAFLSDPETCHLDGGYEPFREMDRDYDALMEKLAGPEGRYMVEERASCRVSSPSSSASKRPSSSRVSGAGRVSLPPM